MTEQLSSRSGEDLSSTQEQLAKPFGDYNIHGAAVATKIPAHVVGVLVSGPALAFLVVAWQARVISAVHLCKQVVPAV